MVCPKCGFEPAEGLECARCGVIFSRYKGPVVNGASPPREQSPPPLPPAPPAAANGATVYLGPGPAQGADDRKETVYQGPAAGEPSVFAPQGGAPPPPPAGTVYGARAADIHIYRPLRADEFLKETFSIYFSSFFSFVLLTALAMAPALLLTAYAQSSSNPQLVLFGSALGGLFATLFCQPLATAAITYGVFQQMRGADASIGSCLRIGLASLLPVLAVAIVQGCALSIGMLLFCVGYFIFLARFSVAIPVAIEERPGAFAALTRSGELTDGYRWPIFFTLLAISAIGLALGVGAVLAMQAAQASTQATMLAQNVTTLFTVGLSATATAVIYYRLRCVNESMDVDQIASVFS